MDHPLFETLPPEEQRYLTHLDERYHFSFQQQRQLIESACDLAMWQLGPLQDWIDEENVATLQGKARTKTLIANHLLLMQQERGNPTNYQDFVPDTRLPDKYKSLFVSSDTLMGRCPCPVEGEKTRCCNLKTLDVVQQCAFGCSYCSIQSFYNKHEVKVVENLSNRLQELVLDEDTWHIGTGQSSDSLLWGNNYGTLDALAILASRYPNLIIELKTKSKRSDYLSLNLPLNIVSTWSLNAPTIIEKEEHLAATLRGRLDAARRARDKGRIIGFHLHPMVYFKGWQEEYGALIEAVTSMFLPDELMMFSLGTLTFTKAVLRQLRTDHYPTRVLDMELTPAAGKYSYPLETKQTMFSFAYEQFPSSWKQGSPFFYLCMEDPSLWEPTFGYSYLNDKAFEAAMKTSYQTCLEKHKS
ncbi:SPL family radical SAM protein [Sphaerochaeta halotolerans]|uniref:SPL family radical SAM protein n=1 Tax=Sphaerochaeta halotolerans TaxID=2293840 RepID=UPI00136F16AE|nr:DNA photolyase [Sphaerochaeta halotolerans]MXI86496.1 DNA photolyase [Sphaerochaeta halotolerans]